MFIDFRTSLEVKNINLTSPAIQSHYLFNNYMAYLDNSMNYLIKIFVY